jgi:DinB superfamily
MTRTPALWLITALVGVCSLQAQDNPISTNMKQSWNNSKNLLQRMAEKMPEEDYSFKPTPEMQSFGQRMAHVIGFNMRGCAQVKGEQKNVNLPATASKADILAAMKQANDECDDVFNSLTDAEGLKTVAGGRGGPRTKIAVLSGTVLEHSQEMYGYLAVYLRLKGIVPPSSDRNER